MGAAGGEGSAPTPFDLFLSSIATCAGVYALGFCQSKGLSTEGLKLMNPPNFQIITSK
ncbi:OsmC family protein [Anaerobranca gottschalkii]|uniref:OsmC family protein n=1 Tax=Anaerobranca gottschalkii TaxID=108328 RepID=UPI000B8821B7